MLAALFWMLPALAAEANDGPGVFAEPSLVAAEPAWIGGASPSTDSEGIAPPRWGAGPTGSFLRVRAGVDVTPDEREHRYGLIELGISIDGWVRAGAFRSAALAAGSDNDVPGAPAPLPQAAPFDHEGGAPGVSRASPPPPTPAPREPSSGGGLTPALARATVAVALQRLGSASELGRLDGMAARSRAAASLPEVRLGARTSRDESLRLTPTLSDPARFTRDGGRDLWLEARLTWRLDRALFSDDEIAVERLKAQHRDERARMTREVLDALLDWQRARLRLADGALLPEEDAAAQLAELDALARLDVATGGWFSRQVSPLPALARPVPNAPGASSADAPSPAEGSAVLDLKPASLRRSAVRLRSFRRAPESLRPGLWGSK